MKRIISAVLLLVAVTVSSFAQKTNSTTYKLGDIVSDFKLKNVDGTMRGLVSDAGKEKGYIVIFTCNHCPYAKAYEQRIMDLDKTYRSEGYPVVAINSNDPKEAPEDSFEKMAERSQEKNYTFPYLFDETQAIAKKFGAVRTPQVFLLHKNKQGKLELVYTGAIDNNWEDATKAHRHYVEEALTDLSENLKPATAETKAIGCTIKWRKK